MKAIDTLLQHLDSEILRLKKAYKDYKNEKTKDYIQGKLEANEELRSLIKALQMYL